MNTFVRDVKIANDNTASDEAQVESQIAAQLVDSVVHEMTVYNLSGRETPERKQKIALAYLNGGVPRTAERKLHELVFTETPNSQRIYYYVLAVFSERGPDDFDVDRIADVRKALRLGEGLRTDEWKRACQVVRSLVERAQSDNDVGSYDAVEGFGDLSADRQDEISRHLTRFVGAGVEQRLDAKRKRKVGVERLGDRRRERARLFFEPEPSAPTHYQVRMSLPDLNEAKRPLLWGLLASVAFAGLVVTASGFLVWAGVSLVGAGCAVVARYGVPSRAQLLRKLFRKPEPREPEKKPQPRTPVDVLVDNSFREARPQYAKNWPNYAAPYRTRLKKRFNDQIAEDEDPKQYKWLFDWHARRVAARWPHHDRGVEPEAVLRNALQWQLGGIAALLVGVVFLAVVQRWLVVPLVAGGWMGLPVLAEAIATRRTAVRLRREAEKLFADEHAEYERWSEELKGRPSDAEMARWLALDKAHLRAEAVRKTNLAEHDLVSHVVINQMAPGARRGSVRSGPPRYTKYDVMIILLTRFGVRTSRVRLDFTTGALGNEDWDVFGYDRIASASLKTKVRTVGGATPTDPARTVHHRRFSLGLLDGTKIIDLNERVDLDDADVEEAELEQLAAATSGMDAAFPVLRAVALHGPAWITHERGRRALWSKTWSG
ncbi:hypothetical protein [Actinokineospora bangkokensis]|uniref:Uncharacterized protein n=1 Tax=Actinokineospora bangkokensis TaxID=1193682 RepID=A0A1Q9LST0_9PSEU|nr:hypothetical protein [Actinokineospora bangkokensis]OLR95078.1 hypothetical protein BJP25_09045 [Actinokineospora bangkokensis]